MPIQFTFYSLNVPSQVSDYTILDFLWYHFICPYAFFKSSDLYTSSFMLIFTFFYSFVMLNLSQILLRHWHNFEHGFKMWSNRNETATLEKFWSWAKHTFSSRNSHNMECECVIKAIWPYRILNPWFWVTFWPIWVHFMDNLECWNFKDLTNYASIKLAAL